MVPFKIIRDPVLSTTYTPECVNEVCSLTDVTINSKAQARRCGLEVGNREPDKISD
jgi:hypothetical protein